MRRDHRGITFIELIIAMAVTTIIMAAATALLGSAQRNYRMASATIDLQTESQIMMEQIGHWVMEGNRVSVDAAGQTLTIYQIPNNVPAGRLPDGVPASTEQASKRVIWISANKKLYMKKFDGIADPDHDTISVSASDETDDTCIGEYVSAFKADVDNAKVSVSVGLEEGIQKYKISNEFKVRNQLR